jgi:hypothetical protein
MHFSQWLYELQLQGLNPVDDISELLLAGVLNLGNKIVTAPDDNLAFRLVELWSFYFGTVVPYVQGVFLPVRIKWKSMYGNRLGINARGGMVTSFESHELRPPDIRSMALITFRDLIVLPLANRLEGEGLFDFALSI